MNEDLPILPLVLGCFVAFYLGYEIERNRTKLRKLFNVFDKDESVVADALEQLVNSGALKPWGTIIEAS